MRVIAGDYGGRNLKTLSGKTTRPTGDKVRAAMFSIIGPFFDGGQVLDLYAGSGGLAIEAVSRGIARAVLVERDYKAQAVIVENISMTKEPQKFELLRMDAKRALDRLSGTFDIIFLDPPYADEQIEKDISHLESLNLLSENTIIVCETDQAVVLPTKIVGFDMMKQKNYGISKVTIYERGSDE